MIHRTPQNRFARRRAAGMTLVEIMISMVILAFGMLGVAALQARAITESSGGRHLSDASSIARNRLEQLSAVSWDAAVLDDTAGAWTAATAVTPAETTYSWSERITNDGATHALTTIKSIEVRVTWNDSKRQNRSVVLSSARLKEVDE